NAVAQANARAPRPWRRRGKVEGMAGTRILRVEIEGCMKRGSKTERIVRRAAFLKNGENRAALSLWQ
ncbi:hypothetical protein, partial [Burkholderia sp. Cy-647]|uniref:hypothetical protein n=1 Tax=Burkholderia sp. Cy-647 TaxID=2608328 RepID=UPI001965DAEF